MYRLFILFLSLLSLPIRSQFTFEFPLKINEHNVSHHFHWFYFLLTQWNTLWNFVTGINFYHDIQLPKETLWYESQLTAQPLFSKHQMPYTCQKLIQAEHTHSVASNERSNGLISMKWKPSIYCLFNICKFHLIHSESAEWASIQKAREQKLNGKMLNIIQMKERISFYDSRILLAFYSNTLK